MHLKKDKLLLAIVYATTLLGTGVHGSNNSSSLESESNFTLQDALDSLKYPRTKENITRLVDMAKKLVHEIYGCENGTIWCPASTRMTDLLFGVLIHNPEEEISTNGILKFMNDIMKAADLDCPIRHTCTCTTISLVPDSESPEPLSTLQKMLDRYKTILTIIGCKAIEDCGLRTVRYSGILYQTRLMSSIGQLDMKLSYRAILYFLDEILYLVWPCSHSCKRLEDGCESHDLDSLASRWRSHHLEVKIAKEVEEAAKKTKKKKVGKRKQKKIQRRKKRRNSKNKKSKSGGSSEDS